LRFILLFLLAYLTSGSVYAAEEVIPFEGVQSSCVQVGGITFGPNGRWANCQVMRGRWVVTIDFLDMYQAQYCLGNTPDSCEQRAQVMFANHQYTKNATVLLVRLDEAGTKYDDPIVVNVGDESVMSMASHNPNDELDKRYFIWRTNHWVAMESQTWKQDLASYFPKGTSARQASIFPDLVTMSTEVSLFNTNDADCCPTAGMASIEFDVEAEQFKVKQVKVHP
jgi:hypothetical protein